MRTEDIVNFHQAELHPLWPKWVEIHKAAATLLGANTENPVGFASYTYFIGSRYLKIEDAEEMDSANWDLRFDINYGLKKFLEWAQEQENGQDSSEKAE